MQKITHYTATFQSAWQKAQLPSAAHNHHLLNYQQASLSVQSDFSVCVCVCLIASTCLSAIVLIFFSDISEQTLGAKQLLRLNLTLIIIIFLLLNPERMLV